MRRANARLWSAANLVCLEASGTSAPQSHDDKRHGTLTLFAALNYLEGKLISRTETRHTHVEWLRFLKQIDRDHAQGTQPPF